MRNHLARLLLSLASKLSTEQTICSAKGGWKFKREWVAVPYIAEK